MYADAANLGAGMEMPVGWYKLSDMHACMQRISTSVMPSTQHNVLTGRFGRAGIRAASLGGIFLLHNLV